MTKENEKKEYVDSVENDSRYDDCFSERLTKEEELELDEVYPVLCSMSKEQTGFDSCEEHAKILEFIEASVAVVTWVETHSEGYDVVVTEGW